MSVACVAINYFFYLPERERAEAPPEKQGSVLRDDPRDKEVREN